MIIKRLQLNSFRNIDSVSINPSAGLNLIAGPNASGKSSLLEGIYLMSRGRSFRTSTLRSLIKSGEQKSTLFSEISDGTISRRLSMALSNKKSVAKLDGAHISRLSELSRAFPVQLITPRSYELLTSGPKYRRKILYWGLFHVEQSFLDVYRRFAKALAQRNAALRSGKRNDEINVWNIQIASCSLEIFQHATDYVNDLRSILLPLLSEILSGYRFELEYKPGWDTTLNLLDVLLASIDKDREIGYTRTGPQRADLHLTINGQALESFASNGQQKLVIFALLLSQLMLYKDRFQVSPVLLLDDFAAELDQASQNKILTAVDGAAVQCLSTGLSIPECLDSETKVFHVEHGVFHDTGCG